MRPAQLVTDGYYHVYNRGVDKRKVFLRRGHFIRFIRTIHNILNTGSATQRSNLNQSAALKRKVQILCYCLMPNHYHFLIKQLADGGITEFMHKLDTSYTKYINLNLKRTGHLFEYRFKAKMIEDDDQLIHVSRYIHINPLISEVTHDLDSYEWSSYLDYTGRRNGKICQKDEILYFFQNDPAKYRDFVNDQIAYAKILQDLKEISEDEDSLFL